MEKGLGKFSEYRDLRKQGAKSTDLEIAPAMGRRVADDNAPEIGKFKEGRDQVKAEAAKPTGPKFAKGGSVSARADGCAQRGKTKGKII